MVNKRQRKQAEKKFDKFKNSATEEDISKINSKIHKKNKGALKDVWDKVTLLGKLIKDPNAAWASKASAIGALLYVISPIDAIPDLIPVIGLMDDVGVIALAVGSLGVALNKYQK
ncbi:YkvA family protein [Gelidibacter sp.]|uniref:YkvA family protein n=1 Tax=Gelidibacter sp. TaxID=2018083 RepID=UPI002C07E8A4|nr:YkvA family protein [Gelidibacter sp.]HUH28046.1 YkvA family protein [Gelidibacter sp.]